MAKTLPLDIVAGRLCQPAAQGRSDLGGGLAAPRMDAPRGPALDKGNRCLLGFFCTRGAR